MDLFSWLCSLSISTAWPYSDLQQLRTTFQFASLSQDEEGSRKGILIQAEKSDGSDGGPLVTFSIHLEGFHLNDSGNTLWVSSHCPLSSKSFLFLLLQLLNEIITRAPAPRISSTAPFVGLSPEIISQAIDKHSDEEISKFFHLIFLGHLFWLCVFEAPTEVGLLYFQMLSSNINLHEVQPLMKTFLVSLGADGELHLMRSFGYMLSKLLILKELQPGQLTSCPSSPSSLGFSYATESHGLLVLKAYTPVLSMPRTCFNGEQDPYAQLAAKESLLRYSLGHQLLEAVVQYEYTVSYFENCIQICIRVDNIRLHVTRLGFNRNEDKKEDEYMNEKHLPSRVRAWVAPMEGSTYVGGLSLGRSTSNLEREVEAQKVFKGSFGNMKTPKVKATAMTSTRTRMRNWRWDQDAEGNEAVFEAILCDNTNGMEVATWLPSRSGDGAKWDPKDNLRKRYSGACRSFTKSGGLVFAGDEYGEEVRWRVGKEMAGRVLKWKLGGKVWVSYFPNEFKTNYFETRCVEWVEEVEMPLPMHKSNSM